jgi:dTDP-4-dehydrorhamnose reductase
MVVLVTGGKGQLGQAMASISGNHPEIVFHFADSSEVDITDKNKLSEAFEKIKPDFCVNAAAYTAVDKAEIEAEKATLINVDGAKNLAEVCKSSNCTLIHISTDFVFDGQKQTPYTETDETNPQGIYGMTKRLGEEAIELVSGKYFIIRTSWLYSEFGQNFMKTMLRLAAERDSLGVVNDQIGTPTNAVDLAEAIITIIKSGSSSYGVYHFSNEGSASWYYFAKRIFQVNDVSIDLKPITTVQFPTPAKRPQYSVMDKAKIKKTFGIHIRHWEESLKRFSV